ncbi:MAG: hypothetical protein ABH845_03100 [Candidatus Omnitrophota bacterium]
MKRTLPVFPVLAFVVGSVVCFGTPSEASDWDKAGKALAVMEGVRIITGGNVDLIGNVTGINRPRGYGQPQGYRHQEVRPGHRSDCVWVPRLVWVKKYVPRHEEYSEKYGTIIIEAHYIKYQVERGGQWVSGDGRCKKGTIMTN